MISRDVKALDQSSAVFDRLKEYSTLFERLDVVVMGRKPKHVKYSNTEKLYIYDTTSKSKLISLIKTFLKTLKIARKSTNGDTWISSQDPFESGLLAFVIAKISHIKLQVQFHTDCFNIQFIKHRVINYFRALAARFIFVRADSVRVVSDRIKSSLLTFDFGLATKIHVLPIWTDVESIQKSVVSNDWNLRNKFPEFKKIILIIARLESEKNIELSLRAFKKVLRINNEVGLIIAGNGSKENWLKNLTKSLGIERNVRFLGWVGDTASLYKTSDILLVTSFYEGYGLNMVEAVACGCPVVATDVGVSKELDVTIVTYDAGQIAIVLKEVLDQSQSLKIPEEFIISKQRYLEGFKNTFN